MRKQPDIGRAIDRGLAFLGRRQESDGSFISFSSASMVQFRRLRSWRTTFVPALMLASLSQIERPDSMTIRRKLADFLLEQKDDNYAFNYWARSAPEYRAVPYPNDLDDTFCALAALQLHDPNLIDEGVVAAAVKLLLATESKVGGPYRSWLVPKESDPIWLDVDPAVNSNIAYFLSLQGSRLPSLDRLMGQAIRSGRFMSPYYPSVYAFIYYFARGYEGPESALLLERAREAHAAASTSLDRALCISARLHLKDGRKLNADIRELLEAQRADGSWAGAAFYADPVKNGKPYYNGGPELTTAFVLEALQLYADYRPAAKAVEPGTRQPRETAGTAALALAKSQCRGLPPDLRRATMKALTGLADGANGQEIIGLPEMFNQSLRTPLVPPAGFLETLGLANLYGWLAYTIYDDFLDEEGRPGLLPSANVAMRRSLGNFAGALPDSPRFIARVHAIFDAIDGANTWELRHCRFKCEDGKLHLGRLPEYGDLRKLAERSLGQTLAPLAILYARKTDTAAMKHTEDALSEYLIVRQLNDDLHDWQEDLRNGHITYVVAQILAGLKAGAGRYDSSALEGRASKQFWYVTLPAVCRDMERRVARGRRALGKAGIFKDGSGVYKLFEKQEASIRETLAKQSQAQNFLKHYRGKTVRV